MRGGPANGMGSFVQQLKAPQNLFRYQSGRVIALGRVMLGILFLLAVWLDRTEPVQAVAETYALLIAYALFAILTMILTWRNWWLDARLAVITHGFDMAVFTAIVFSTNGSTSPFFLFFVLPLLAAAIRWSWRETALTAAALVALYFAAGLLVSRSQTFELERFVVRSGHLMILSLLLIWFGVHQRFGRLSTPVEDFDLVAGAHQIRSSGRFGWPSSPLAREAGRCSSAAWGKSRRMAAASSMASSAALPPSGRSSVPPIFRHCCAISGATAH